MAIQFLKGLSYLHNKGILHRDLSYRNVLIQIIGDAIIVKISDFGLAKDHQTPITSKDSSLKGTLLDPCLSSLKEYNIQNEMYSIGLVLWYIFTGKKNYKSENTGISEICSKCISPNLNDRFNNVDEIIFLLSKIKCGTDSLPQKLNVSEIKGMIIEKLSEYSANELPDLCSGLGLESGNVSEAFKSKRTYVSKRLHSLDLSDCIDLITKIESHLGIKINIEK